MPQVANLVINDGRTTPIAHTFEPARTSSDMVLWEDRLSPQFIGFNKLTLLFQRPQGPSKSASRNLVVTAKLETPILETLGTSDTGLTPAPTVAYRIVCEAKFTLPERALKAERRDVRLLMINALSSSQVGEAIDSLSMPW